MRLSSYCLLITILLTLIHCTPEKTTVKTDIDQLYAVQYDSKYKDSLAKSINPEIKTALDLSNTHHNRIIIDSALHKLRWTYDSINFKKLSHKAIKYATDKDDKYFLASTYNNIGMYYHDLFKLDSTYYYYLKTENIYKSLKDTLRLGETKFFQARLLFEMGLFMESESKTSQSLSLLKKYPKTPVHYEANQLMALCLIERKEYTEAERYLNTSINLMLKDLSTYKILDKKHAYLAITAAYGNLAEIKYLQNNFQESKKYSLIALNYAQQQKTHPVLLSFLKNNLAKTNYKLTKKTIYLNELIESYHTDSVFNNTFRMYYTAIDLAKLYQIENNNKTANKWANNAYQIATTNKILPLQVEALEFLLLNDDYGKKNEVKLLIQLRQTLSTQENQTRNTFARIAYETEIIEQENNKLKDIIFIITIIGVGLVLILLISSFRFKLKAKNKELKLVNEQRKANENINKLIIERNLIGIDSIKKERNRIAKDLHDSVVNAIFTIRFNLQLLETNNNNTKQLLITELEKLENNTRDISHDLINNRLFNDNKFLQLVEEHILMQVNSWETSYSFHSDSKINFETFNAETKVNLFFILREAIQNINKYSKATQCTISFTKENNYLKLIISDNGIGFEQNLKNTGLGINNMHERALKIKGELLIKSQRNQGTTIILTIPFNS